MYPLASSQQTGAPSRLRDGTAGAAGSTAATLAGFADDLLALGQIGGRIDDHQIAVAQTLPDGDAALELAAAPDRDSSRHPAAYRPDKGFPAFGNHRLLRNQQERLVPGGDGGVQKVHPRAHLGPDDPQVGLLDADFDLHRALLAVRLGINLDQDGVEGTVGIGVGNHAGGSADRDFGDVHLIDIDFGAHVVSIGKLDDVGGAAAGLDIAAVVDGVAQFAILLEHDPVDRRRDVALADVEFGVVDRRLGLRQSSARHAQGIFGHVELVARFHARPVKRPQTIGLRLLQSEVGGGKLAVGDGLAQLSAVIAVVDARQQVAPFDVLALFDRLFHDLAQDFGPDRDVLVPGDHVARAGQHGARLIAALNHGIGGLNFERTAQGPRVDLVAGQREYCGNGNNGPCPQPAKTRHGSRFAPDPERLEFADPPARAWRRGLARRAAFWRFGRHRTQVLRSASTTLIFIAWRAGKKPPATPIAAANASAWTTITAVMRN